MSESEFSRMYHESFANRQKYQWRFSFTIWGASVAIAGYSISKGTPEWLHSQMHFLAIVYWIIGAVYAWLMFKVNKSHAIDKSWKHYFRDRYLERDPELPLRKVVLDRPQNLFSSEGFKSYAKRLWDWAEPMRDVWYFAPLLVTILFFLTSFEVIKSQSTTIPDKKETIEASSVERPETYLSSPLGVEFEAVLTDSGEGFALIDSLPKLTLFEYRKDGLFDERRLRGEGMRYRDGHRWQLRILLLILSGSFLGLCLTSETFKLLRIRGLYVALFASLLIVLFGLYDLHLGSYDLTVRDRLSVINRRIEFLPKMTRAQLDMLDMWRDVRENRTSLRWLGDAWPVFSQSNYLLFYFFVIFLWIIGWRARRIPRISNSAFPEE